MIRTKRAFLRPIVLAVLSSTALGAAEEGWPGFRGPRQDGISTEVGIRKEWPKKGLPELWRIDLGAGFSGFAAAGDRLYTLTERSARQEALCLDAATGKEVWSRPIEAAFQERQGGDGPRATPALAGGAVFVLGARGTLASLAADDGRVLWKKDVLREAGGENITWGLSGSPLIDGDRVIVQVGSAKSPVAALDRKTGDVLWRSEEEPRGGLAGYATPYIITHRGKRQVVVFLGRSVAGLDPETGKTLWSHPWRTSYDVNAAAPVHEDGLLFISSGYNTGCAVLELPAEAGGAPRELWRSKVIRNKFSSSVLHQGHLYGFDENRLKCVELRTGQERWRQAGLGHGSLLLADGHLIVLGDQGSLALARATPERYVEVARMDEVLQNEPCWTAPVLHRGVLLLRDLKQAVALRLRAR